MKRLGRVVVAIAILFVLTFLTRLLLVIRGAEITALTLFWIMGFALILPWVLHKRIDWFEPLWLFLIVYFLRFWLRPFLVYVKPDSYGILGWIEYPVRQAFIKQNLTNVRRITP